MKEIRKIKNDEELTEVFKKVGEETHYRDVSAHFNAFRDMKVKWTRSYSWIDFTVSDYLKSAPEAVIRSVAETIFGRINGDQDARYNEDVSEWVSSEDFVKKNQPIYVSRCVGMDTDTKGSIYDLRKSYNRLVESGLLEKDNNICLGWVPGGPSRHSGFSSVLMKTIAISKTLDSKDIPEEILDYCIFAQAMHVKMGFDPATTSRFEEYDRLLDTNPERENLEKMLEEYNIVL